MYLLQKTSLNLLTVAACATILVGTAHAQISKADNTDNLDLGSSWVGGTAPMAGDIAQYNNTVTGANTSDIGAGVSWLGLTILNPGGAITITGTGPSTLTLGGSGINMAAATQNLTISAPLVLGAAQPWSVAAGRVLRVTTAGAGAISGTGPLTINGPGQVRLGGLGATYTFTGGTNLSGGTGLNNVAATGSPSTVTPNLIYDLAAITPSASGGLTLSPGALRVGGGQVSAIGGAGNGSSAFIVSNASLTVNEGQTNFTMQRGGSARVIYQFGGTTARSVGGTVNFRDDIAGNGNSNANTGGYRMATTANVNGVVPFITYTTTSGNTSWFVAAGTSANGTALGSFTSSTATALGTSTQNATVVTDADLTGTGANTVNTVRFNDTTARTVTIGASDTLTIGAAGILVTNNGTADHTISGAGMLMGGNPGSGSGNDLIVFQHNNSSTFTIGSVIADNSTTNPGATAFTKAGAGKVIVSQANTYTGATFIDAGTLQVDGSLAAASAVTVKRGGTLGGIGTVNGAVTVEAGGKGAPGASIGTLNGSSWVWNSDNTTSGMIYELSDSNSTSDLLNLTGAFTKGAGNSFLFDFSGGLVGQTYTLVNFNSTDFTAGNFGIATAGYAGNFIVNSNSLQFGLTGIPEPGAASLLLGGVALLAARRRYRRAGA